MARGGLTPEQNERVRGFVRELLRKYDGNQSTLAPKLGFTQPAISSFLSGRTGTTYTMVERLAKLLEVPEWEILGKASPKLARMPPRELAAELAREIGVSEEAIAAVLEEEVPPERAAWPALWWADRMRRRDLEMLPAPPSPPAAAAAKTKAGGPARKKAT